MPQIILKERTAHLGGYTFLQEMWINIKSLTSLSQLYQTPRTAFSWNTYHWLLLSCEYRKVFKNGLFFKFSRSSCLQIFLKIGILKSFANFTGKHLCWSLFLKNLQAEGLQFHKKRLQRRYFPVKFAKFLRTPFLTEHLR